MGYSITEPNYNTVPNPFGDDYCDCEDRCGKCGKKKKHKWHPMRYTCDKKKPRCYRFTVQL